MTTLFRLVLWIVWCAVVGWLWHTHMVGTGLALVACALALGLFAWPSSTARRRSGQLRYIEMAKQPLA